MESSHFILCVCLDETPLEPIWTFELCSGHFECFLFGTAVWLAETVIKIFGCQSKRNGLALWWAIIRKRSWREKKTLNARVWWKNICGIHTLFWFSVQVVLCQTNLIFCQLGQNITTYVPVISLSSTCSVHVVFIKLLWTNQKFKTTSFVQWNGLSTYYQQNFTVNILLYFGLIDNKIGTSHGY